MLRFNAETHEYFLGDRLVPSVTQVLKTAGFINDQSYSEEGSNRGAAVHKACEYLDRDELDWDSLHSTIRPYVKAYRRFKDQTGFLPELIEHQVYNEQYFY